MKWAGATLCIKGAYAFFWTYIQNFKTDTQENTKVITVISLVSGMGKRREKFAIYIKHIYLSWLYAWIR